MNKNDMIYLDTAASSRPELKTINDLYNASIEYWNNPSSIYQVGMDVNKKVEESRNKVRDFINAERDSHIIFGSCASEMLGLALNNPEYTIVTSSIEHPSLYNKCANSNKDYIIGVDKFGQIDLKELERYVEEHKDRENIFAFASINSEIGVIQKIKEISDIVHRYNNLLCIDHSQGACHYSLSYMDINPLDVQELGIDMLVMTSEKIGCPRGTAVLYCKNNKDRIRLKPLYSGGNQQDGYRAGTENVGAIIMFGNQLERIKRDYKNRIRIEYGLRSLLCHSIYRACNGICNFERYPYYVDNYEETKPNYYPIYAPNIVSVRFDNIDNGTLSTLLDLSKVCCSTGSACSSYEKEPSRVLTNIGLSVDDANSIIRFSFDYNLQEDEAFEFGKRLKRCLKSLSLV